MAYVSIGITRAHATLRDAIRFLGVDERPAVRMRTPSRVLGNGLRELDRFLSILIDEVATATAGIDDAALDRLRTRRNTANKLRMLHAAQGLGSPHHRRLRALGRSRDCLFYCDGLVRRADDRNGSAMTAGWRARPSGRSGALATSPLGSRLAMRKRDLADICHFYDALADDLLAGLGARSRR